MVWEFPTRHRNRNADFLRQILLFPFGNNVDHASFYLEHAFDDKPRESWYACVQFMLVLWNKNDPSIYAHHCE